MQRRQFLGAAAAVWNLPHGDQLHLYTDTPTSEIKDGEGEKEYPREVKHGGLTGSFTAENYGDVEVSVSLYPYQAEIPVSLELYLDGISISAAVER